MKRSLLFALLCGSVIGSSLVTGCGSSDAASDYSGASPGGTGLSPGGAQDFGRFKALLEAGKIPGPETLDQVGFFAEHKIGTPPTSCSDPVCAAGQFGAMNNMISGSTCTLLHLALGTPLDPQTQPRPPVDVAVVVDLSSADLSGSVGITDLTAGLGKLLDGIDNADTVTLISVDQSLRVLSERVPGTLRETVRSSLRLLGPGRGPDGVEIYDGLRYAVDALGAPVAGRHRRVVLVSGAQAKGQIPSARTTRLLQGFAEASGGVTVLALGEVGNLRFLQSLADAGAGTLYNVRRTSELPGLFDREVSYSLIPVAEKVVIRLSPGRSYRLREVFGINAQSFQLSAEGGTIRIPALFAAWRKDPKNIFDRRGGGGAILVEVLPRKDAVNERPATVGNVEIEYNAPGAARKTTRLTVTAPDGPFGTPSTGRFSSREVEKGFVVLNLYVGLRMASERAAVGDLRGAYDVLSSLEEKARQWNTNANDLEVYDDLRYVQMFLSLLAQRGADSEPPRAVEYIQPWPRD